MAYIGVIVDTEKRFQRKAKFTLEQATKAQRWSRVVTELFL